VNEIKPDKEVCPKVYGLIEARDGNSYRCARGGFGPRGAALEKLQADIADPKATPATAAACVQQAFTLALEPFYSAERIASLWDNDFLGFEQTWKLWEIVNCEDLRGEKKSSADLALMPSAGA
jgi:hypothetical protein